MAIVVEDGSGMANAVAYVDVDYVSTYAAARGLTFDGTTAEKEAAVVLATDYLDAVFGFTGSRLGSTQALSWPRTGAYDNVENIDIPENLVPATVKRACAQLAVLARNGTTLLANYDRGGMVKSETVGPISVTYMDSAPAEVKFGIIGLIKGLLDDKSVRGGPEFLTPEDTERAFVSDMYVND